MQSERIVKQFGLWSSPVSAASVASAVRITDVQWTPDGRTLVWREERSGKGVLVAQDGDSAPRDLTDSIGVRARVGYGGGDFAVGSTSAVVVDQQTGGLVRVPLEGGSPRTITPVFGHCASPAISPDERWVLYVNSTDRTDVVAIVDIDGNFWPQKLAWGHDFFMQPTWSADGRRVAWIAWDHPNMPWDGTRAWIAELSLRDGRLPELEGAPREVAGGDSVAVSQPMFSTDGESLILVSDANGWGQVTTIGLTDGVASAAAAADTEFGIPPWMQGMRTVCRTPDPTVAFAVASHRGFHQLARVHLPSGGIDRLNVLAGASAIEQPTVNLHTSAIAVIASSPVLPPRLIVVEPDGTERVVRRSASESIPAKSLAYPEPVEWKASDGGVVHGLFFEPVSEQFASSGRPPLVVLVHGGPTSQSIAGWSPVTQFLATRGFAVLMPNYRGSTGYGREYMLGLRGTWGVTDVDDCVSGALALSIVGRVDGARMAIMGGSAGGFTVLQTMIDRPDVFAAGVSLYGVSNQFALCADTHKFEEMYTQSLIGALPEAAPLYRERSPEFRAREIRRPMAIFQGADDEVVPQNQSDAIVAALAATGTPHVYHVYAGEGHGWRKSETIDAYLNALERFLRQYLVFA
ncbi:MAG: S9 family peptidase [Acidobacteria bacterium]|nr:S9 family peptidase [Acidobacteriota bacterium]